MTSNRAPSRIVPLLSFAVAAATLPGVSVSLTSGVVFGGRAFAQEAPLACNLLRVDNHGQPSGFLNLRESPNGPIVKQLEVGAIVTLVSDPGTGWYVVSTTDGLVGYAFARYLVRLPCAPVPRPTPQPPPAGEGTTVARCYDGGGPSSGRVVFSLEAVRFPGAAFADRLTGRGVDGTRLAVRVFAAAPVSGDFRSLEASVGGSLTQPGGRVIDVSKVILAPAPAGSPRDAGRVSVGTPGFEKSFSRCVVENQSSLHSRAGTYELAACHGPSGDSLAELRVTLDAEGRLDRLVARDAVGVVFDTAVGRVARHDARGRSTWTLSSGAGFDQAVPTQVDLRRWRGGSDMTFRYEGIEERYARCRLSNEFLLDGF